MPKQTGTNPLPHPVAEGQDRAEERVGAVALSGMCIEAMTDAAADDSPAGAQLIGLRIRKDYLAANAGKRAPMPGFVLLVRSRGDDDATKRIGITVSKKVGNAVVRNRMKRRFRALAREILPSEGVAGADHVLIGRNSGIERDFAALKADLRKALARVQR